MIDDISIWPDDEQINAWPSHLPRGETIENFKNFYRLFGFEECTNENHENGYEKVALYCNDNNEPLHAARSLEKGIWASKLGTLVDIEHLTLKNIECENYGKATYFFKRPLGTKIKRPEMHNPSQRRVYMPWDNC